MLHWVSYSEQMQNDLSNIPLTGTDTGLDLTPILPGSYPQRSYPQPSNCLSISLITTQITPKICYFM